MSSKTADLSIAIVEAINATTDFSMAFTARRRAVPFESIEEIREVEVALFDATKAAERLDRTSFQRTYKPTLAVMKKLLAGDDASRVDEVDELHELVEEIENLLTDQDLAGLSFVGFDEEQDRDPYGVEIMKLQGAFVTIITLEYTG